VRAVGNALGLEAPRVNALAQLVPLLSSHGAIDEVMNRGPELGIHDLSTQAEPYNSTLRLAVEAVTYRWNGQAIVPDRVPPQRAGVKIVCLPR
jgi:hypothetical protein